MTIRLKLATGAEVRAEVHETPASATDHRTRPRCLLIHGNPGTLGDWARLIPLITPVMDVAAIDLPGFGESRRSDSHPASMCLDQLATHALAAADALSWHDRIFVIGHSHGGGVAQTIAARFPERVSGIACLGSLGAPVQLSYWLLALPGVRMLMGAARFLFQTPALTPIALRIMREVMKDIFAPELVGETRLNQELATFAARPEILQSMVDVTLGKPSAQLLEQASKIRCPALFLHGQRDALVPSRCADSIHQRIRISGTSSEICLLPEAGHMLIEFQAKEVAEQLERFVLAHGHQ